MNRPILSAAAALLVSCAPHQNGVEAPAQLGAFDDQDPRYSDVGAARDSQAATERAQREAAEKARRAFYEEPIRDLDLAAMQGFCDLSNKFGSEGMTISIGDDQQIGGDNDYATPGRYTSDSELEFDGVKVVVEADDNDAGKSRNPVEDGLQLIKNKVDQMSAYIDGAGNWTHVKDYVPIPEMTIKHSGLAYDDYYVNWNIYQNRDRLDEYSYCEVMTTDSASGTRVVNNLSNTAQPDKLVSVICLKPTRGGNHHSHDGKWDIVNFLVDESPRTSVSMQSGGSEWVTSSDGMNSYMVVSMVLMGDDGRSAFVGVSNRKEGLRNLSTVRLDLAANRNDYGCQVPSSHNTLDLHSDVRDKLVKAVGGIELINNARRRANISQRDLSPRFGGVARTPYNGQLSLGSN